VLKFWAIIRELVNYYDLLVSVSVTL